MTSPLLCSLLLLTMTAAGVQGSCSLFPFNPEYDPVSHTFVATCPLGNGTVKYEGDSWIDEEQCMRCSCPGGCCSFGFGMSSVMGYMVDGERCKPVRTGDCRHFKFVKPSDPSVVCDEFPK